jgi:hypothetical protein
MRQVKILASAISVEKLLRQIFISRSKISHKASSSKCIRCLHMNKILIFNMQKNKSHSFKHILDLYKVLSVSNVRH